MSHGYLDLDVETDEGRKAFTMRWTASQAIDFGTDGKLIIDTEDNRYVVRDVESPPKPDRERFQQYVLVILRRTSRAVTDRHADASRGAVTYRKTESANSRK